MELEPPDMMAASRCSTRDTARCATSGTWIASLLTTPARWWSPEPRGSWYRTRFPWIPRGLLECLGCLLRTPARISSSSDSFLDRCCRSGSSAASCSAMSPVSVQEDSESESPWPAPSSESSKAGSSERRPSSDVDWCCSSRSGRGGRVRSGILEGRRRLEVGGGILEKGGLFCSSPNRNEWNETKRQDKGDLEQDMGAAAFMGLHRAFPGTRNGSGIKARQSIRSLCHVT